MQFNGGAAFLCPINCDSFGIMAVSSLCLTLVAVKMKTKLLIVSLVKGLKDNIASKLSVGLCFLQFHLVRQGEVTLAPLQQQPRDVCVAPLGREHQGRGSLAVLDVGVCSTAQQQPNHHNAPVSHRQVQSCLARLRRVTDRKLKF